MPAPYINMEQRLITGSVLDPVTDCWVWIRARSKKGYARINVRDKNGKHCAVLAHAVAAEVFAGRVAPPGFEHDHKCKNRACINPAHTEVVTKAVNLARRCYA